MICLIAALLCLCSAAQAQDLNTDLMLSTVKIANPSSTASGFLITRPAPGDPRARQFVFVSANHVFAKMQGEEATIFYHKREPDGGFTKVPAKIKVRGGGKDLWTKHPSADVAVLVVTPPAEAIPAGVSIDLLASDEDLRKYEVHPGDSIRGVGFPHPNQFEANAGGFPVVRGGCIASYPLLPTNKTRTFLFDVSIFEGMSGGPVYLYDANRYYGGRTQPGRTQLILGLTSGQHWLNESYNMVYGAGTIRQRLELAIIVHASAIRETIDLLPKAQARPPMTAPATAPK